MRGDQPEIPLEPIPAVPIDYGRPRDLASAALLSGQAELLSRFAAHLESTGNKHSKTEYDRARLAREMSAIYFRAAELEEKS